MKKWLWISLLVAALASTQANTAEVRKEIDERTGLNGWIFEGEGIRVELIQRLPDQTRAFFLGRGFDSESVDRLASHCVFQTIIHNTSTQAGDALEVRLAEWRVLTATDPQSLILKEQWQEEWQRREVSQSARIAFQWALFPSEQDFQPGDWNMGMTSYPVSPGKQLDLKLIWHINDRKLDGRMTGMVCADNDYNSQGNVQ